MFAAEGAVGVTWIAHGKGSGWVVNDTCGSTHAPAVLWFVERYRRALKERAPDERCPPTQKEISMKKVNSNNKGRRSDGENDAHEKGDRSIMLGFAIFAHTIVARYYLQWSAMFNAASLRRARR